MSRNTRVWLPSRVPTKSAICLMLAAWGVKPPGGNLEKLGTSLDMFCKQGFGTPWKLPGTWPNPFQTHPFRNLCHHHFVAYLLNSEYLGELAQTKRFKGYQSDQIGVIQVHILPYPLLMSIRSEKIPNPLQTTDQRLPPICDLQHLTAIAKPKAVGNLIVIPATCNHMSDDPHQSKPTRLFLLHAARATKIADGNGWTTSCNNSTN